MENTKILLLDDREENLISLKAILNRDDITIFATTSPNEALRIVWENEIAVALVDVQMPGMDGFEFAETLASNPKTREILIVFVTAISKETTFAVRGLKTGAIDYLYKPLDPYITNAKVDSLIRLARSQREIREKNRLLENYATIVTNSPDIICTVQADSGRILSINPSVKTILNLDPEKLINISMLDLLVEPMRSGLQSVLINQTYLSGDTIVVEDQFFGKFRQPVWLELRIMYKNRLLFINLHDIEKRKAHELALVEARSLADKSRKVKEAFLANMSHEIRTPLNGIIGIGNLLEATDLDSQQRELLEMLLHSSGSLLNILNDILDISKIDEGKFSILPTPTNLSVVGKGIVDLMRFKADEKRLQLSLSVDKEIPDSMLIDGMRLNQILMNLVGNALKFTHAGYVKLKIQHMGVSGDLHEVRFSVEDSGIGISEDRISAIFSAYGQATLETSHNYGGTGLGLTISQKLVLLMDSELKVASQFQKGSEFYFTVMLKDANQKQEKKSIVSFKSLTPYFGKKVLVAEDNHINSLLINKYLTTWLIDTTLVVNGKEAVDAVQNEEFDLIIMDTRMPEMDGFQAASFLRKELKVSTPILSLSATVLEEDLRQAIESGMNDTLSKPFEPVKLHEKIGKLLSISV
ncbi:PAS domain S-box-containing protein [Dyadobacter koreensis]|uniref:Sensory/regulatory protein RpfC n=1 Tax=Dyadobacter koreensis TaxID=408657 RepID=A0A1H6V045_9BACT|nr:response regulator [Dyadobacter koreensis]SEI96294.1 PAS domain S-box-containing protein [Dyadobacter koreensis]